VKAVRALLMSLACCAALSAQAREAVPMADDPVAEARLLALSEELRCLVCQNETLAASRAELAEDLRNEIRGLIRQNKSDKEIKDYLVSRYGDFVLYRPPVTPTTWLLWFGPFVFLLAGVAALVYHLRRRTARGPDAHLTDAEIAQAEALLKDKEAKA
jgi:cytochrome c-type biogenesis protein CcmH